MMYGLLNLSWWGTVAALLIMTQITIIGVTVYLHRCQAHRALELHPIVSHFFRFWLWMTTGMVTKEWTAIHRKHHAKVETEDDPHSPQTKGIWKVLFNGAELYRKESRNIETLERYGQGTPDDWIEHNIYTKHSAMGIAIMLFIDLALFGTLGLAVWAIQMAWIPFWAAGVVNGVAHYIGYRNFECADASRNILPIAFFIGGEELHNNHHTYATSAKFSVKWWEFDIGWMVIRTLQFFGLAKPKRTIPKPVLDGKKTAIDIDTVKALITNRFYVLSNYSNNVMLPVLRDETKKAGQAGKDLLQKARTLLIRDKSLIDSKGSDQLSTALEQYKVLNVVYDFREKLQNIWARSTASQAELLQSLQDWCKQAESSGVSALKDFVDSLKGYVPKKS
ncbi:fatty acid desaturase [Gammaproteobacteria bacterium]|nr:fatty acid desaturase [Gammaproteobacteria bacterium]